MAFYRKFNRHQALIKPLDVAGGASSSIYPSDFPHVTNAETLKSLNAAGTGVVDMLSVDADNDLRLAGVEVAAPFYQTVSLPIPLNGAMADTCMFIAPYAMKVAGIQEIHATKGSDAGAVTINLTKDVDGVAPGAGTTIMSGTFNGKGDNNTLQSATLSSTAADLTFAAGDRIGVNFTGTLTALAGLVITLKMSPGGKGDFAIYRSATGGILDQAFFIANAPMKVKSIRYAHSTKGTDGGTVNVQVTKDTSTDAPGAGTDMLTDNSNAGFNCKGANNTVQTGTLTATAATLWLAAGDRLSVDFAGTTTALAGAIVVVEFEKAFERYKSITFTATANADCVDRAFFIADRTYRIVDARYVNATAGNDAGSVNAQLTVDNLTNAPGAGVDVLSNNTSAGWDCKTTANTVVIGTFISEAVRYVPAGARLAIDFAGTVTTLAGAVATVLIEAI